MGRCDLLDTEPPEVGNDLLEYGHGPSTQMESADDVQNLFAEVFLCGLHDPHDAGMGAARDDNDTPLGGDHDCLLVHRTTDLTGRVHTPDDLLPG